MDCTKKGIGLTANTLMEFYTPSLHRSARNDGAFLQWFAIDKPPLTPSCRHPEQNEGSPVLTQEFRRSSLDDRPGDDYYWLHQQQLQNSALQFKPLPKVYPPRLQEPDKEETAYLPESDNAEFERPFPLSLTERQAVARAYDCPIWTQEFSKLIKTFSDKINQSAAAVNPDFCQKKLRPSVLIEPLANKQLARAFVFKNHQLFIAAQEAEFSFNSSELSKEQIKELSLLVKQWLNIKGIRLIHLIINGVKQ